MRAQNKSAGAVIPVRRTNLHTANNKIRESDKPVQLKSSIIRKARCLGANYVTDGR